MKKYDIAKIIIQEKGPIDINFKANLKKQLMLKLDNKLNFKNIMKKVFIIGLSVFLLICVGYFSYRFFESRKPSTEIETNTDNTAIANPASTNCEQKGGTLKFKDEEEGQVGYCYFEDGSFCEEWAFMRGECKKGDQK